MEAMTRLAIPLGRICSFCLSVVPSRTLSMGRNMGGPLAGEVPLGSKDSPGKCVYSMAMWGHVGAQLQDRSYLQQPQWLPGSDILVIQSSVSSRCHQLPSQWCLLSCYPGASQNLLTSTFPLPACWHVSLLPGTHRGGDLIGPTSHDTKSRLSIGQQLAPQHPAGLLSL